jgi:hypothetical protein
MRNANKLAVSILFFTWTAALFFLFVPFIGAVFTPMFAVGGLVAAWFVWNNEK